MGAAGFYEPPERSASEGDGLKGFGPYGDNAVVWQQDNEIWSCNLESGAIKRIWGTTNTLIDFSY